MPPCTRARTNSNHMLIIISIIMLRTSHQLVVAMAWTLIKIVIASNWKSTLLATGYGASCIMYHPHGTLCWCGVVWCLLELYQSMDEWIDRPIQPLAWPPGNWPDRKRSSMMCVAQYYLLTLLSVAAEQSSAGAAAGETGWQSRACCSMTCMTEGGAGGDAWFEILGFSAFVLFQLILPHGIVLLN